MKLFREYSSVLNSIIVVNIYIKKNPYNRKASP